MTRGGPAIRGPEVKTVDPGVLCLIWPGTRGCKHIGWIHGERVTNKSMREEVVLELAVGYLQVGRLAESDQGLECFMKGKVHELTAVDYECGELGRN